MANPPNPAIPPTNPTYEGAVIAATAHFVLQFEEFYLNMKHSLPDYTDLKYHSKRLYQILLKARSLADKSKWDELEEYSDSKLDEVISLSEKAVASETGVMENFGEEYRWEFFSTLMGSHEINMLFGRLRFKMSLNLEGDCPVLMLT